MKKHGNMSEQIQTILSKHIEVVTPLFFISKCGIIFACSAYDIISKQKGDFKNECNYESIDPRS